MNRWKIEEVIEEVCKARGIEKCDLISKNRSAELASARRAIAVICRDKFSMSGSHNSQCSWLDVAKILNCAHSSLYASAMRWRQKEGAEDGQEEERLRQKRCLLPQGKESIHEMAKRLCKRRLGEMPQGRRRELGYWRSKEEVNHG